MLISSEQALEELGVQLISDVQASQRKKNLVASRQSAESLAYGVKRQGQIIDMELTGAGHWQYQQQGRRANRRKGRPSSRFVAIIRAWIQIKGLPIPLKAAGAIAYKIVNEGIPVPNPHNPGGVLSEPLDPERVRSLLKPKLKALYFKEAKSILFS